MSFSILAFLSISRGRQNLTLPVQINGKLLGLPMEYDICDTNHADSDQDELDTLLSPLGMAGVNYIMGIPIEKKLRKTPALVRETLQLFS